DFKKECPRCSARVETLNHALKDCPTTRAILALGGLYNRLLIREYSQCIDWIEDIMRVLDMKAVVDFITTLGTAGTITITLSLRARRKM
ncbi:hypothetical protein Godav_020806, partial [Gossypium davidsonii]|nr:hypothetical protein [Gossypium davidsonii]